MGSQTVKIIVTGEKTVTKVEPVNLLKVKIQFIDYSDPVFRCYFEGNDELVIEGGSGEITLRIYE